MKSVEAGMGDRVDELFQQWHKQGGAVLLAQIDQAVEAPQPETLIAESTAYCRDSGRLTWVVLSWLLDHIDSINTDFLFKETKRLGDLSVLGVLADAANLRSPHPKFEQIIRACPPNDTLEPFFHRVAKSALASQLVRENALDVFRRWNYLSNELRYLQDG